MKEAVTVYAVGSRVCISFGGLVFDMSYDEAAGVFESLAIALLKLAAERAE